LRLFTLIQSGDCRDTGDAGADLGQEVSVPALPIPGDCQRREQQQGNNVTRAAENGGPMIFAQMGMLQAIHRHQKRAFNPERKVGRSLVSWSGPAPGKG